MPEEVFQSKKINFVIPCNGNEKRESRKNTGLPNHVGEDFY
jgi:hypothetical protein